MKAWKWANRLFIDDVKLLLICNQNVCW
jgi:hypothetical protein